MAKNNLELLQLLETFLFDGTFNPFRVKDPLADSLGSVLTFEYSVLFCLLPEMLFLIIHYWPGKF